MQKLCNFFLPKEHMGSRQVAAAHAPAKRQRTRNSTNLLESALGGTQQWAVSHTAFTAAADHDPIVIDSIVALWRMLIVITTKVVTRSMLKLKLRMILSCDSTLKIL